MKMQTALALLVLGICATTAGVLLRPPADTAFAGSGQKMLPGIEAHLSEITQIRLAGSGKTTTLALQNGKWGLAERAYYPVQPQRLRALFTGLSDLRLLEPRTADPALYGRLGVDAPTQPGSTAVSLQARTKDGALLADLLLGHRSQRSQGGLPEAVYVRRPNEAQSWLAEGQIPADSDPQSWLVREVVDLPRVRIARVSVTRGGTRLEFTRAGDGMAVAPAPAGKLDTYRVDEIAQGLEGVTLADVRAGAPPGTTIGTAVFTTTDGLVMTVALTRDGQDVWASFAATGKGAEAFAPLRGWAYELPLWREKTLLPIPSDLVAEAAK